MKLVSSNKQPKHDDPNVEQPADATATAPAASVTWAGGAPEVSAEISVELLQKQHAEAVAAEQSLIARQAEIGAIIASRRQEVESCAELAANGNQGARSRSMALRAEITALEFDADNLQIALKRTAERVGLTFRAHDEALANEQRAAAAAEVLRRLDEAIDADRVFFSHLAQIATSAARLTAALESLRAPELQQALSATSAQRLSDSHAAAWDALPPAVRNGWGRAWGGPRWISFISKDAALL